MGRPAKNPGPAFTSRELAMAAGLSPRNFSLLHDEGLAPEPIEAPSGKAGHRLYDSPALAHAALIGALHLAGFELLVSARLAQALASNAADHYGKLHSNLQAFLHEPYNPTPGKLPWRRTEPQDLENDFWLHGRVVARVPGYQAGVAVLGDMVIDIADHAYVMTERHGLALKVFSPVSKEGLPASPDYRIVGRGSAARIVPLSDELDSCDVYTNPAAKAQMKALETDYLTARENAVARVRINVSLAIRNAFDRVRDGRPQSDADFLDALWSRRDTAVLPETLDRTTCESDGYLANACHANAERWCERHPEWSVVRGWLIELDFGHAKQFVAHSLVRDPDGGLLDVTPLPNGALPFLEHVGDEASFQSRLPQLNSQIWPPTED